MNPPIYCTLTLITMQGCQNMNKEHHESRKIVYFDLRDQDYSSSLVDKVHCCYFGEEGNLRVIYVNESLKVTTGQK